MGEVWRARDPRLGRDVAIKVLPAALAGDPERRARFERECRLLASLNHAHVASVLGLEDADGAPALVMELVEGPTLADRIAADGAFAPPEALALARQMAEAVEFAHERGIVHRDLKPGNVKLTPEGEVKVLDFGLAKALAADDAAPGASQLTQSPTLSLGTQAGVLLGTAAYMAPEQARGKAVDRRADIWAFGAVLFEMLTGRQAFAGETVSDTIARILERQPEWDALPARTPRRVRELLERCLEKDPKRRLRDIGDARLEIEAAIASGAIEAPAGAAPRSRVAPVLLLGAVALAALAGGFLLRGVLGGPDAPRLRLSATVPEGLSVTSMMFGQGGERALYSAGLPAGSASSAERAVYRRAFGEFEWRKVAGTEGVTSWDLSLDGHWVYVLKPVAEGSRRLDLVRVPVDGAAPPVRVRPWDEGYAGWDVLPDQRIIVVERGWRRFAVLAPGAPDAPGWRDLACEHTLANLSLVESLPDGRTVLAIASYFGAGGWTESAAVFEIDSGRVAILEENASWPWLMPGGQALMTRAGTLLAAPWDAPRRRLGGPPAAVMQGLRTGGSWGHSMLRVSPAGDLGVVLGADGGQQRGLAVVHADGRVAPWNDERRSFERPPAAAPGGRLAAVVHVPPGGSSYEILLLEAGRPGARRFAAAEGEDCFDPRFSPDGRTIAWVRQGAGSTAGVYVQPLDGSAPPRRVLAARSLLEMDEINGWYPDGRSLLVSTHEKRHSYLRRVALAGDSVAIHEVAREKHRLWDAALSPDGRRVAFLSDESGETEVVVAALRPDGRAGLPVPVSRGYGVRPQWADGGATLLWATRAREVMGSRVSPALEVSAPERRADLSAWVSNPEDFAVLPGGGLLVVRKADGEGELRQFDLVLDYGPELARVMKRARAGVR